MKKMRPGTKVSPKPSKPANARVGLATALVLVLAAEGLWHLLKWATPAGQEQPVGQARLPPIELQGGQHLQATPAGAARADRGALGKGRALGEGETGGESGVPDVIDFMAPMPAGAVPQDKYTAMCAKVHASSKEEQEDLREWVLHHVYYFGMKIYIYDHESAPSLAEVLKDYVSMGAVEVHPFQFTRRVFSVSRMEAYSLCLNLTRGRHEWVAFFDYDEYLWQTPSWKARPLRSYLQQFEGEGGLAVSYQLFCSSGHVTRPKGVRRSYTKCSRSKFGFRSIVRPNVTVLGNHIHWFNHTNHLRTVLENFDPVTNLWPAIALANIHLNHYFCQSKQDFEAKVRRKDAQGYEWEVEEKVCRDECTELVKLRV